MQDNQKKLKRGGDEKRLGYVGVQSFKLTYHAHTTFIDIYNHVWYVHVPLNRPRFWYVHVPRTDLRTCTYHRVI